MQKIFILLRQQLIFIATGLFALAAIWVLIGCKCSKSKVNPKSPGPDIILVSIDSLRQDHLGCYGYHRQTSPTIDKLAQQGVRCTTAVSTTSWTLPAHAALFTGLYNSAHGLIDVQCSLEEEFVTLAEVLKQAGYQTAGFFGGPLLHPAFGFNQGFTTYQSCMTPILANSSDEAIRKESHKLTNVSHSDITGPRMLEKFRSWLKTADEQPFFVFFHMWDVHYDYIPPQEYIDMFDSNYTGTVDAKNFMWSKEIHRNMPKRDLQHVIALYDAEIRFTDDILGKILAELDSYGRLEQTLIVITADHGEEFFEHKGKGHNRTLYDEVVRVPLIFHWPGHFSNGGVINEQVRLIDIMPTILGQVSIPLNTEVQGRDISELLQGKGSLEYPAFCELMSDGRQYQALRTGQSKVIVNARTGTQKYFDLLEDPGEQKPLIQTGGKIQQALTKLAAIIQESITLRKHLVGRQAGKKSELDEEMKQRLESLGYIGSDTKN